MIVRTSGNTHEPERNAAAMVSFWRSLKRELVHRCQFAAHAEVRAALFEWIEVFYKRERLLGAPGYHSPVDFEINLNKIYPGLMLSLPVHAFGARPIV